MKKRWLISMVFLTFGMQMNVRKKGKLKLCFFGQICRAAAGLVISYGEGPAAVFPFLFLIDEVQKPVPIRILTIPFDSERELFFDDELRSFLLNKKVKLVKPEFFQRDGRPFWSVFVDYEVVLSEPEKKRAGSKEEILDETGKLLLQD